MLLPRKIRKLIALLRGQVSPVLVCIAVGLGFWFGLIPGFTGVSAVILVALVLLNVPVGLFLLFAGLGKSLCFAAAPTAATCCGPPGPRSMRRETTEGSLRTMPCPRTKISVLAVPRSIDRSLEKRPRTLLKTMMIEIR